MGQSEELHRPGLCHMLIKEVATGGQEGGKEGRVGAPHQHDPEDKHPVQTGGP